MKIDILSKTTTKQMKYSLSLRECKKYSERDIARIAIVAKKHNAINNFSSNVRRCQHDDDSLNKNTRVNTIKKLCNLKTNKFEDTQAGYTKVNDHFLISNFSAHLQVNHEPLIQKQNVPHKNESEKY